MNNKTAKLSKEKKIILTEEESRQLPYFREFKKLWTSNVSHFSTDYKSVRHNNDGNGVYEDWTGMLGFLRFYVWLHDHKYIKGKTELKRIDEKKGFYPENLLIVKKRAPRKNSNSITKQYKTAKASTVVDIKEVASEVDNHKNYLLIEDKKLSLQLVFNMLEKLLLDEQYNINQNQLKEALNNK